MKASFVAYMQQTDEQYSFVLSLLPTHCSQATFLGILPSAGRMTMLQVGPVAESILSNSVLVTTFLYWPYPSSGFKEGSYSVRPAAMTMLPTLTFSSSDSIR